MAHPQVAAATSQGLVLDVVRSTGPISRVELAQRTGLTQATITHLVRRLLADGLLMETGKREYTGGKPRVMLTLNPRARCGVGVQLGADWIVVVVTDASGAVLTRTRVRGARTRPPGDVVPEVARHIETLLRIADVAPSAVAGIGIAAPGVLDLEAGSIVSSPSLVAWEGFPLREALEAETELTVVLDNDATCAAVGEFWKGGLPGSVAHSTIYMGATISAGVLVAGSAFRGATSNTGPLGRLRLHGDAESPGRTVEEVAGPAAVAADVRAAMAAGATSTVRLSAHGDPYVDFAAIATAAVHGDQLCTSLVEKSARHLADAVLVMVDLLDLDSVVLAGPSFTTAGSLYLPIVEERVRSGAFAAARHQVSIGLSPQVTDAAAVGAASLVLQKNLSPRRLGVG